MEVLCAKRNKLLAASIRSVENNTITANNHIQELVHSSLEEKKRLSETASAMKISAADAAEACRNLTELGRRVDDKVSRCEEGAQSLSANSELVVLAAENARTGVQELEDSISSFRVRESTTST